MQRIYTAVYAAQTPLVKFVISRPPKAIAADVFVQYFLIFFFINFLVYALNVAGTVVHLGDLVLGREVTQASAGGCRANNVR